MNCPKCRCKIREGYSFCMNCGAFIPKGRRLKPIYIVLIVICAVALTGAAMFTGYEILKLNKGTTPKVTFSASIGEIDGTIYATRMNYTSEGNGVYKSQDIPTCRMLPVLDNEDHVISSFCYYDGYVYYIESENGSSCYSSWLYRCKTDWTEKELLDEMIYDFENPLNSEEGARNFIIDDKVLYYRTYLDMTTCIDLSTLEKYEAQQPVYKVVNGNKEYSNNGDFEGTVEIYNDIVFFTDEENNLYRQEGDNNVLIATDAYLDGGYTDEYLYYTEFDMYNSQEACLYRMPIDGNDEKREFIDANMPAGGGGPYFCW